MKLLISQKPTKHSRAIDFEIIFPDDTPSRYINAIRRVLIDSDVPTKYLHVTPEDMKTEDKRFIPEYTVDRIAMIPIHQSIPLGTTYSLSVINNNPIAVDVYAGDLIGPKDYILYPEQEIGTLFKNEYLIIDKITVMSGTGMERCALGGGYFAGKNHLTGKMTLTFQTYGTLSPRAMVRKAIDVILKRLATCRDRVSEALITEGGSARWVLVGIDSTIVEMIYWAVATTYGKSIDITVMDHKDYGESEVKMNIRDGLVLSDVLISALGVIGDFFSDMLNSVDYNPIVDQTP